MSSRTSRGAGLALASILFASTLLGCPLLKKKAQPVDVDAPDDDTTEVIDAATVSATGLGAKNEADLLRYANETPLANEPAVIGASGAHARNFPGNGPEVAFLAKGTAVTKVAQYFNTATLVMFDAPAGDGTKLAGWVSPKAFDTTAPTPTSSSTPPTKAVVPPRVDAGSSAAAKDAGATVQDAGSSAAAKDAGATVQDAGSSAATKDAGAPPKTTVDAGGGVAPLPQPARGVLAVPPVDGKCPDGWAVAEGMCRRKCAADAECPRGTKCATKQGTKVCTSDH